MVLNIVVILSIMKQNQKGRLYGKLQRLKASDPTTGKRRRREEKRREEREEERKEKREEKRREERGKEEIVWKDAAAEGTRPRAS